MITRYLLGVPFVTIMVQGKELEAIIDTGFNASILLPIIIIKELGLKMVGSAKYSMADGKLSGTRIFIAEVDWMRRKRKVEIVASESDFPLVGMQLLNEAKTVLDPQKNILTIEPSK